jgi:hypothetical protein
MRRSWVCLAFVLLACGDNNSSKSPGDAGPDPDGPQEEVCRKLDPLPAGTCAVTAGDGRKLLEGNVLLPGKVLRGGQVAVDANGKIACVGCDCAMGGETKISCPDGAISPGLINTHDHITFTQNNPYVASAANTNVRYDHRHQWRKGQDGKPRIPSPSGNGDQVRWGELRFVMGGATSIVGSGGQAGLLRNLDQSNQEGLGQGLVNFDTFPLGDRDSGARRDGDCDYGGTVTTAATIADDDAYEPHTSEGIDKTARNEFLCESSTTFDTSTPGVSNNLLLPKTAMIHAVGLTAPDYAAMATANTALIWSPRSNISLYGDTARVTTAARLGVEISLGTDWMPTGSMNLLRELKCADSLNKGYYDNYFSDEALWRMVTINAAAITATDDVIGVLAEGKVADISIFTGHGGKTYRAVIDAEPQDVALVIRGGKVLYGEASTVGALATGCDVVDVCGTSQQICLMSEVAKTYDQLKAAAAVSGNPIYPAFACGVPMNEPSCTPYRDTYAAGITADDSDGDGIPNANDKCPKVFDPIRPIDSAAEADFDGDGQGDACDVCPLDANSTMCSVADPNDRDGDGKPNTMDNCPDTPTADQADADGDGKGDVCDACPGDSNPGAAGCPATIYAIKKGELTVGTPVVVNNVLVTGKGDHGTSSGFFVQVKETDGASYMGADYSGMFVFVGSNAALLANATVGARVNVSGRVANFNGQIELDTVTDVTVVAAGPEAPPAPIATTYAEIKTGGTKADEYEGVIVSLGAANVTAVDTMFNEYTLADALVPTDTLVADDFLFLPTPLPTVGQGYLSVRGILNFRNSASKIEPRDANDLTVGAPGLASFGPALSYARVGSTTNAPTFPTPLTITLTAASATDTTVVVTSNSGDLTVASVLIPAGDTSAPVPVTAVAQNADVTLTAMLGVQMAQAHVRVLGAAEVPSTVTLEPSVVGVAPGGTVELTVSVDVPAPTGGTTIGLAVNPSTAGTLPATVMIPANATSQSFMYTNALTTGSATITATLGTSTDDATVTVATGPDHVVIRQVYGGGGNSGAPFTNDFIELYNPTSATVSLGGKSLQYASATGTGNWIVIALPATGSIAPGGAFLVQLAGGATGSPLPTPDHTNGTNISAAQGKTALVDGTTPLAGACPADPAIIDLVGYGTANCSETATAPTGSNTMSLNRAMNGCADTDDNSADFTTGAPMPRNSATPPSPCS